MNIRVPLWDDFFLGADVFFPLITSFRVVYCAGGFGSGKTLLSVALSAALIQKGLAERVVANIDIKGKSNPDERIPAGCRYYSKYLKRWFYAGERFPLEDSVMFIDEGHLFLDTWGEAKDYVAALRKTNLYLMLPSIWPPAQRLRFLEVRRTLNLYTFGIPGWYYHWSLKNGPTVAEKGNFILWRPHRIFPIYATSDFPSDDGGIIDALTTTFRLEDLYGNKAKRRSRKGRPYAGGAGGTLAADGIEYAANDFADSFEQQSAAFARFNRQRR